MSSNNNAGAGSDHWGRDGLGQAILDALAASGKDLDSLNIDDLAPMDHFHGGGKGSTVRLAQLAGLTPDLRVLDVGGGLGGPARTLAVEFGCHVTVIDLTDSYVQAARELTTRLGLTGQVTHQVGNALDLPFDNRHFDVVWTQNSGMNIQNKELLYAGFHRVLRSGGLLALGEPMAGPMQPPIFPLMWAVDAATSFLRPPTVMRALIESCGFEMRAWNDVTPQPAPPQFATPTAASPTIGISDIVMGDSIDAIAQASALNRIDGRIVNMHGLFARA